LKPAKKTKSMKLRMFWSIWEGRSRMKLGAYGISLYVQNVNKVIQISRNMVYFWWEWSWSVMSNSACVWTKGKIARQCLGKDNAAQRDIGSQRSSARKRGESSESWNRVEQRPSAGRKYSLIEEPVHKYGLRLLQGHILRPTTLGQLSKWQFNQLATNGLRNILTFASLNDIRSRSSWSCWEATVRTPCMPVTTPCRRCSRSKYKRVTVGVWAGAFCVADWSMY